MGDLRGGAGVRLVAGIGFTVAPFLSDLASADPALGRKAATGVLAGSVVSAVAGWARLRLVAPPSGLGMFTNLLPGVIDTPAAAEQPRP